MADTYADTPSFTICLPWPPSLNTMYRTTTKGGIYKDPDAAEWQEAAIMAIRSSHEYKRFKYPQPWRLRVEVMLYPPTRHKYDVDNRLKALHDALERSEIMENDNQIYQGAQMKFDKQDSGYSGAAVRITRLPDDFGGPDQYDMFAGACP